jgi:hypothetical protein
MAPEKACSTGLGDFQTLKRSIDGSSCKSRLALG